MPSFPNYRLYHQEGSPCDTLPPTAAWNHQANALQLQFTSISTHDIRSHLWTFGDGSTDTLPHLIHTYAQEGSYEVCLEVSNPRGTDSYCDILNVYATDNTTIAATNQLSLHPNPSNGLVYLNHPTPPQAQLVLFDIQGQKLAQWTSSNSAITTLDLAAYPPGIYWLQWIANSESMRSTKVILE